MWSADSRADAGYRRPYMEMAVGVGALGTDTAKQVDALLAVSLSYSSFSASVSAAALVQVSTLAPHLFPARRKGRSV